MRIRTIKPEFFTHEGLFEAEAETKLPIRVAFAGLWCAADREGRFRWEPRRLGIAILPYDKCEFSRVLDACLTRGFVVKYRVNGVDYGLIPSFVRHQIINNREKPSDYPEPAQTEDSDATATRAPRVEHAASVEGKGKEGKGKEGKQNAPENPPPPPPAPPKPTVVSFSASALTALHESFCALTGNDVSLSADRQRAWSDFVRRGFTEADFKRVVWWIRQRMNAGEGGLSEQSLTFRVLIGDVDKFEERLHLAQKVALTAKQGPPPPEPPDWRDWALAKYPGCRLPGNFWDLQGDLQREFRTDRPELGWKGARYIGPALARNGTENARLTAPAPHGSQNGEGGQE